MSSLDMCKCGRARAVFGEHEEDAYCIRCLWDGSQRRTTTSYGRASTRRCDGCQTYTFTYNVSGTYLCYWCRNEVVAPEDRYHNDDGYEKVSLECAGCGAEFEREKYIVTRKIKIGQTDFYHSGSCFAKNHNRVSPIGDTGEEE